MPLQCQSAEPNHHEFVHVLVKVVERMRLVSDEVVEPVGRVGVDEAVAYPLAGLDATRHGLNHVPPNERITYASELSAMSSKASSTPSSPMISPESIFELYASRSNLRT
jgi:hypothetical protein